MKNAPPLNAILQRDKETFAIVPRVPCGVLSRQELKAISDVVEKYDIPLIKITSGQRIALVGLKEDQLAGAYQDLGMEPGKATELCLHYVQACPGTEVCKFGVQNSIGLGMELETILSDLAMPAKLKVGVSGCQFCCAESFVRDIGLVGKKQGWTVIFGGHSGNKVREGDVLAEDLEKEQAILLVKRCVKVYQENAKPRERAGRFVERFGLDEFKAAIAAA